MTYDVWDLETRNLAGSYPTLEAALAVIRNALRSHGESYVETLALVRQSARRTIRVIAQGRDLVAIAQQKRPVRSPRSGSPPGTASRRRAVSA